MNDSTFSDIPEVYSSLQEKCEELGFSMPSDLYVGSLLKTLIKSKPNGHFLELGTGIGLSLAWMVDGLCANSRIISIDNDEKLIQEVIPFFEGDDRVEIVTADGSEWLINYDGEPFDLIFADAWPGKFSQLDEALAILKKGGFYIIDDMSEQPNWPDGHAEKAKKLITHLEERSDITMTKLDWSTGVIIGVKK